MTLLKTRKLERIIKGFSNNKRIKILELLGDTPELSVGEISERVRTDIKNGSQHIRRMEIAGLVLKRSQKNHVRHKLSPLGVKILSFLKENND